VTPTVGLSGLVLGLGEGYLTPRYGFGCDSVLAAELVTADGAVLQVSAEEHPELFWGLRGAGANLGVVTALRLQLHPMPDHVIGGWMRFAPEDTLRVTQHAWGVLETGLPGFFPFVVYELDDDGRLFVRVLPAHRGAREEAEREVDAFRRCARPVEDGTRSLPYPALLDEFDAPHEGPRKRMAWDLYRFPFEGPRGRQVETLLAQAEAQTAFSHFTLWRTIAPPPPSPAAAPRHRGISFFAASFWSRPEHDEAEFRWLRATGGALEASGMVSEAANAVNHVSFLDERRLRRLYGRFDYARLARLKAELDPENRFRSNANIPPA
jgi:FAD/FMN-containing dehydrogenase